MFSPAAPTQPHGSHGAVYHQHTALYTCCHLGVLQAPLVIKFGEQTEGKAWLTRSMLGLNCAQQPSKQHSLRIAKNPFQNHLFMGTGFIMKELVQIRGRCQGTFNTLQKGVTQLHHGMARKKPGLFYSCSHHPHCLQQDCSGFSLASTRVLSWHSSLQLTPWGI